MKKLVTTALAVMMSLGLMVVPVSASGEGVEKNCPAGSANETFTNSIAECNMKQAEGNPTLWNTINTIINVALAVIGIVAVAFIIYGGFQYTTSAGDASKTKKAKDTIVYGVIGLVIALLAFAIVNFVLSSVFGAPTSAAS